MTQLKVNNDKIIGLQKGVRFRYTLHALALNVLND